MPRIKSIIFDLDGTLLNSLPDIANSVNSVLKEYKLPTHSLPAIQKMVGHGYRALLLKAVPKKISEDLDHFNTIEARGREYYKESTCVESKVYDGIYELLDYLKDQKITININTNKPNNLVPPIVEYYFNQYEIKYAIGQIEGQETKPNPFAANKIAEALTHNPEEILFVGDSPVDVETAKRAGMHSVAVTWGFSPEADLTEANADYLINTPKEIIQIIKRMA